MSVILYPEQVNRKEGSSPPLSFRFRDVVLHRTNEWVWGSSMGTEAEQTGNPVHGGQSEQDEESRRLRRLQLMMNLVMQVIAQDGGLSLDEASQMVADSRTAALALFPGKELAFDLIYRPRLQRIMRERFRVQ